MALVCVDVFTMSSPDNNAVCDGQSSYCGILPVLWDGPLLCSEVVEDKSPIIDVVETYMKLI